MKEKIRNFFYLLKISLQGKETEFTSGSINRAIMMLSIPMILEMVMESLFAVVDVFFVSKVSTEAVAIVGLTESILMIIYSIAVGLSMAATAVVARRVGEKKYGKASRAAVQAIFLSVVVGVFLGLAGFIFSRQILEMMGAEKSVIDSGIGYTQIMFAGNVSIILLFVINAMFRGAGDAALAMRTLWIANGLNIILDPILIFGWGPIPAYGVAGAAIATTIGRSIGVLFQISHLIWARQVLVIVRKHIALNWKVIRELVKLSLGGIGQFLVETASWIFLVRVLSTFGAAALAGYTIAFRVIVFTLLPSWGLANAAATLVGQNLGAGSPERAELSVRRTALWNMVFLGVISLLFFIITDSITGLFSQEEEVRYIAGQALRIICLGYIFFGIGMVMMQALNGAGDTRSPVVINLIVFWLIQIPLAYFLALYLKWEATGIFISIALCHSLHALVSTFWFSRGYWKNIKV